MTKSSSLAPVAQFPAEAWRDGKLLVMMKGGIAPKRCVKCNAPGQEPTIAVKLQLRKEDYADRHKSAVLNTIEIVGALAGEDLTMPPLRSATVHVYVCALHRPRPGRTLVACIVMGIGIAVAVTCGILGMHSDHGGAFSAGGIAAFVISLSLAVLLLIPVVIATDIDGGVVRMKGASLAFLQSLREWKGNAPK